jgi:hypothetical protein
VKQDQPPHESYRLRVPIKTLGTEPILGLDSPAHVAVGDVTVAIKASPPFLIFDAGDFASQEDAQRFLPRLIGGIWALLLDFNIAFKAEFRFTPLVAAEDPEKAAANLRASWGLERERVYGVAGEGDVITYASGREPVYLGMGEARARASTGLGVALDAFAQGLASNAPTLVEDEAFRTAVDLFNAHFYETSHRARLLTLVMALEVLAPVTEKHPSAAELVARWKEDLAHRRQGADDPEVVAALEALDRELDFRKETSIRQRVRQLIRNAPLIVDREERGQLERRAVAIYDARGRLAHQGSLPANELAVLLDDATQILRRLLRARLGIGK